jgi:hypothetical protein
VRIGRKAKSRKEKKGGETKREEGKDSEKMVQRRHTRIYEATGVEESNSIFVG